MSRIRRVARVVTTCACVFGSLSAFAEHLDMLGMGILRGDLGSAGYDINNLGQVAGFSSGFERGRSHVDRGEGRARVRTQMQHRQEHQLSIV